MSTIVTRLYQTDKQGAEAAAKLKKVGFAASAVTYIAGGQGSLDTIKKLGVPTAHARIYADLVSRGASLVSVVAPTMTAVPAVQILARFDPLDTGIGEPDVYNSGSDATVGLPKIMRSGPTPSTKVLPSEGLSSMFGIGTIIHDGTPFFGGGTSAGSPTMGGIADSNMAAVLPFPTIIRS